MIVIIPEAMELAMKRDLDKLRDSLPEDERPLFEAEREHHRQMIINHFAEYGSYPEIGGISKQEASHE
jgi:hypothetical protein